MLKPAILYKTEIENALKEYFYSDDMMFYMGYSCSNLINVSEDNNDGRYQYAVVGKNEHLIGYIGYTIDRYSSSVHNFNAFSFERGNPVMGAELYKLFEKLIHTVHRVEFWAVSGNPAVRGYDKFLAMHSDIGKKHILTDVFKDDKGKYHDSYIYEFVNASE